MGAQVVSGIGFLGAGTIVVTRRNQIKGLTTAAGLWSAAGVGLALGVGFYEAAIAGTLAVFIVIALLQKMDNKLHRRSRQLEAYIELSTISLGDFLRTMREADMEVSDVQREYGEEESEGVRAYVATLKGKQRQNHQELMEKVMAIPGVEFVEEL
jgi:putative Mg2+ transporter-C (MgtC) family protein